MKRFYALLLALGICFVSALPALAEYPAKPIMLMTAFNAGGGSDVSHRLLEKFAKGVFDQPIIVTYKAGAGGEIGWTWLVGAKADGYTIGGVDLPHIVLQPMLRPEGQPGYKTEQLNPLCCLVFDPDILIVSEKSPFKSFGELIEYAKANPGKVNFATHGALSTQRLFMTRLLKAFPDVSLPHVGYTSGHEVSTALLGRHITSAFGVTTNQKPYVESGDFTMIGVSSPQRLPDFPDVPTFAEQIGDEYTFASSHGLVAPKRVPNDRIETMQNLLKEALADPDVQAKFAKAGLTTDYLPADQFQTAVNDMWKIIGDIMKENKFN